MLSYKITIIPNKNTHEVKSNIATRLAAIARELQELTEEPLQYMIIVDSEADGVRFNYKTESHLLHTLLMHEVDIQFIPASN